MITEEFAITLNGINYRLAEDAEGSHYVKVREPLRAPNSQLVQGGGGSQFNLRADMLLWSWTDWSGGEGQYTWDEQNANRSWINHGPDPFSVPGTLRQGYRSYEATDSTPAALTGRYTFCVFKDELYAVDYNSTNYYKWNDGAGNFGSALTQPAGWGANASILAIVSDVNQMYVKLYGTNKIYTWDGAATTTLLNDQFVSNVFQDQMVELGDYLYLWNFNTGKLYEISKSVVNTTTAETPIFQRPGGVVSNYYSQLVSGDNRVYASRVFDNRTEVYEIVPTSASSTGFGREFAKFPGFRAESMWWQGGFLYLAGRETGDSGSRKVMYVQPGGTYGTLGGLRDNIGQAVTGIVAGGAERLASSAIVCTMPTDTETEADVVSNLVIIDAITGGMAVVGNSELDTVAKHSWGVPVFFKEKYFSVNYNGTTYRTYYWDTSVPSDDTQYVISPANNYGVTSQKILHSIEVVTEPLPSGGPTIDVFYSLDGAAWVASPVVVSLQGGTHSVATISTAASTKTFRELRIKVELNAGFNTEPTVLRAINVLASVDESVNLWELALDCSNEAAPRGLRGADLIDNIENITEGSVVRLLDGYGNRELNSYNTHEVVVDVVEHNLSQPGEGVIRVRLREVV